MLGVHAGEYGSAQWRCSPPPDASSRRRASEIPKWCAISWCTVSTTFARRASSSWYHCSIGPRKIVIRDGTAAYSAPIAERGIPW